MVEQQLVLGALEAMADNYQMLEELGSTSAGGLFRDSTVTHMHQVVASG